MRKIFIPVLTFLMLISFVSCNLDNEGILKDGPSRFPSDNKQRVFIGFSEIVENTDSSEGSTGTGLLYYVTKDGLCSFDVTNTTSNSERRISSDGIFIPNSADIAWIDENDHNKIIYINDYVDGQNKQDYYLFDIGSNKFLPELTVNSDLEPSFGIEDTFVYDGKRIAIAVDRSASTIQATLVDPVLTENTLDIKQIGDSNIPNYIDQMNGLIWYKPSGNELSFSYMNKSVQFKNGENTEHFYYTDKKDNDGNQIKSVTVNNNTMFVLRSIDDNTYIYYGTIGSDGGDIVLSRVEGGVISESISNTPSIIFNNKLFFMKNNSSSSSDLYVVDLTNVSNTRRPHDSDVAKLNPEAFFTINEKPDSVYLLTKDKGVFRIDGTTVTPVPKLN